MPEAVVAGLGRVAAGLLVLLLAAAPAVRADAAGCPERPSCRGCGCRGGTGYRAPDGHCVGFRELPRVCGAEPAKACQFENLPGTGLNHDCALGVAPAGPAAPRQ